MIAGGDADSVMTHLLALPCDSVRAPNRLIGDGTTTIRPSLDLGLPLSRGLPTHPPRNGYEHGRKWLKLQLCSDVCDRATHT